MKKLLITIGCLMITCSASAALTVNVVNNSSKDLEVMLNAPRSNLVSKEFRVPQPTGSWHLKQVSPICKKRPYRCRKWQLLVSQWGKHGVFFKCPTFRMSKRKAQQQYYQVSGHDFTHLHCKAITARQWHNTQKSHR